MQDKSIQIIECLSRLQITINERLAHLELLLLQEDQFIAVLKDEEKKRTVVRNFRTIKTAEKTRNSIEAKCLAVLGSQLRKFSKNQLILCQTMFVSCMNQYLNSDYEAHKSGEVKDILDAFIYYYEKIQAFTRANRLRVIKNCALFYQMNLLGEHIGFFIQNVQQSLQHLYDKQKGKFFNLLIKQNRQSPQKREEEQADKSEKFDRSGCTFSRRKKNIQNYCWGLYQILDLESIYIDYFYFSNLEIDRRRKILMSNFLKRNIHTSRQIQNFDRTWQSFAKTKIISIQNSRQLSRRNSSRKNINCIFATGYKHIKST